MYYTSCSWANVILGLPQAPCRMIFKIVVSKTGYEQSIIDTVGRALDNRWLIYEDDYEDIFETLCHVEDKLPDCQGEKMGTPGVTHSLPHVKMREFNGVFSLAVFKYPPTLECLAEGLYYYALSRLLQHGAGSTIVLAGAAVQDGKSAVYRQPKS